MESARRLPACPEPALPRQRRTRAGSGDSDRRTRSNYPRRTTAVAPRVPIGRAGCRLSRTSTARAAAGFRPLAETARFPRFARPQRSLRSARAASCSVPPRSMVVMPAPRQLAPELLMRVQAHAQQIPTQPPTSVLWPASCPTGPCTAGPCCWAMSHTGSALRRPRRPPHTCEAIATEDSILVGGGLGPKQATALSCPSRGSRPLRWGS